MSLLDDLTSKDSARIWAASSAIRTLRDSAQLAELTAHIQQIRASTKGVDLGGVLRPNSSHLNFALRKLEWVRSSEGCLCGLYPLDDLYDPSREAEAGNVRILNTHHLQNGYLDFYETECALCSTRFRVEEQDYHYTWWGWKPMKE